MAQPIAVYYVLQFESSLRANDFSFAIQELVATQQGLQYMFDPNRAVIWTTPVLADGASVLYVSDGTVSAARELGLDYAITSVVPRSQLPKKRGLYLGDQSDWHETAV